MYTKQKLYLASLISLKGLENDFFENLETVQQQLIDCMFLEFALRMELAKLNEHAQKITIAWAISVYGEGATRFLARLYNEVTDEEIDKLCDMYLD